MVTLQPDRIRVSFPDGLAGISGKNKRLARYYPKNHAKVSQENKS